jgi:guanylate kinase
MNEDTRPQFDPCPDAESGADYQPVASTQGPFPLPEDANPYAFVHQNAPLVIVISGPSGVGKDATVGKMKELGLPFHFVVTATSRPRRPNEVDGVDYHFLTEEEFEDLLARDELLEHALVYDQYKGIPKQQVRDALASGLDVIMRLDVQGAATIRKIMPEAVLIFLTAASEDELVHRLRRRNTEKSSSLETRIATARQEMTRISEFDYVIVNSHCHLKDTVERIKAIIEAERCRVARQQVTL